MAIAQGKSVSRPSPVIILVNSCWRKNASTTTHHCDMLVFPPTDLLARCCSLRFLNRHRQGLMPCDVTAGRQNIARQNPFSPFSEAGYSIIKTCPNPCYTCDMLTHTFSIPDILSNLLHSKFGDDLPIPGTREWCSVVMKAHVTDFKYFILSQIPPSNPLYNKKYNKNNNNKQCLYPCLLSCSCL